jgi:hypothetical protein
MASHNSMSAQFSEDLRRIQKHFNGGASRPSASNPSTVEDYSTGTSHRAVSTVATPPKGESASAATTESSKSLKQSSLSQQSNPFADMSSFKEMSEVLNSIGRGGRHEKPGSYRIGDLNDWASEVRRRTDVRNTGTIPDLKQEDAVVQPAVVLDHPRRSNNEIAADYTKPFCKFLSDNPTVFHTVTAFAEELADAGYKKISERDSWKIKKGGKYFVERNGSSMIAFSVGDDYEPGNGAAMVAGHIDALTAKLKPIPKLRTKAGYVQLGVAPYAGALNSTWWDRDLSIGGRVLVKESTGKITTKLVKLNWPSKCSVLYLK